MNNLFASFDVFPSAKGAATHIAHTLRAIEKFKGRVTFACLGHQDMPRYQNEGNIEIRRCLANHPNFLKRAEYFAGFLNSLIQNEGKPSTVHFRDIWSGVPLMAYPGIDSTRKIYEVNGFASIELLVHYPGMLKSRSLLDRIRGMEEYCLKTADTIITVSKTNAKYIESRGVGREKIRVIPNMAEINDYHHIEEGKTVKDRNIILYSGTLTPWQGVPVLLEGFKLTLANYNEDLQLILACSSKKYLKAIRKYIGKMNLEDKVEIKVGLSKEQLGRLYSTAIFSVAPLERCDRNELQGCCPLKIIESMAAGTPVIASDLPVCREIITHGRDGWLVSPGSPRALAHMMLDVLKSPDRVLETGQAGRKKVLSCFSKDVFEDGMKTVYN